MDGSPISISTREALITPYHEAGHAVMAWSCGFSVSQVTIVPSDTSKGQVGFSWPIFSDSSARILGHRKAALILASGIAADFIHWKHWPESEKSAEEVSEGHFSDEKMANEHLREVGRGTFTDYIGAALFLLQKSGRWSIVENVAQKLIAQKELAPAEISHFGSICSTIDASEWLSVDDVVAASLSMGR